MLSCILSNILIHPAVFICQFEQEGELLHSSGRKLTSGHQLHIPSHPVPHQPLLSSVFRWPPVVLLHKCHYFVVSGLPAFRLGHRRLYGRCAQNSCSGKRLLRRRAIRKFISKLYRRLFFILTRITTNYPLIFAARSKFLVEPSGKAERVKLVKFVVHYSVIFVACRLKIF